MTLTFEIKVKVINGNCGVIYTQESITVTKYIEELASQAIKRLTDVQMDRQTDAWTDGWD